MAVLDDLYEFFHDLITPKWKNLNPKRRLEGIKKITDQKKLMQLLKDENS